MSTHTYCGSIVIEHCFKCGIPFGIESEKHHKLLDSGAEFFCTNGHGQIFTQSTVQKLKLELAAKENELRAANNSKEYWRTAVGKVERSLVAVKGHKTRIIKRIHAGVCPHCNRHFENIHRHMVSKHKDVEK